jgi:hypothetical protein
VRARTLIAAVVLPIAVGACDGGSEIDRAEQAALDAKRELALPAAPVSDQAIASAIELPPPPRTERVEPVVRRTPPQAPVPQPTQVTTPEAPPQPVEPAIVAEAETVPTAGPAAHQHEPGSALAAKGGAPSGADEDNRAPFGRGILIRGGVGVHDDCAIHRPRLAPPEPLINDRMPQVGNTGIPLGGVREPTEGMGAPGGGRGTIGAGGIAGAGSVIGNGNHPTTSRGGMGGGTRAMPTRSGTGSRGGMGGMRGGIR